MKMGKNKGVGKKPSFFKVAGAKSLKSKSKAKPVTGNLKKFVREMESEFKKAGIIIIGDEILKGYVQDLNSNFLCKRFHAIGVKVCRITAVPDEVADIAEEVARFSEKFDIVITTGGIGPTHDDVTYEAIASAFNEKIILHSEMAEVIRCYFHGTSKIETNPALKMALIPQSSKLIYVLPAKNAERHNGLQVGSMQPEKKPFPVVQVKNVFVLPGMMEWLEHAFNHLQKIFENPAVHIYMMVLFLKTSEVKIVSKLNSAVHKFQNHVIFGSYATNSFNNNYQTKITLESTSLDDITCAYSYLKATLPDDFLSSELHSEDAELVYELTNFNKSLSSTVLNSLQVIQAALKKYSSEEIYLSFNGGKDCTVLLHLVWAARKTLGHLGKLNTVYIKSDVTFPEVDKFIGKIVEKYKLNIVTVAGPIKAALAELHKQSNCLKAIFMGTRRTDPYAAEMQEFQMCDKDWPPLMRVNPILDWTYKNIWDFLRILNVPYCSLYDEGYTSIGSPKNTQPNPALKVLGSQSKYYPAYKLKDGSLERQGRK